MEVLSFCVKPCFLKAVPLIDFKSVLKRPDAAGQSDKRTPCLRMNEVWSIMGAIALWLGFSIALWWLRRRWVHSRQSRQIEQANRALALAKDAQSVFDAIRSPVPFQTRANGDNARHTAETHSVLKRIQAHGAFFDDANALRVQIQASLDIDDHPALAEILHLRRDLWAAGEIALADDHNRFGDAFEGEGTYQHFRAEALRVLLKQQGDVPDDDVIDLRLSLALKDAEAFLVALQETIDAAQQKDRIPTISEIAAYPLAAARALPRNLHRTAMFAGALVAHAKEMARALRDMETAARRAAHLRLASTDWPQRLSEGFERASAQAREKAGSLRSHYDFLVAAHDFQSKYELLLRRAPQLTERGRLFIERLELAEHSERLRLTSASAAIWSARKLVAGLAFLIAGFLKLHGALTNTGFWGIATAALAPALSKGRRTSAFRSYRRALAMSAPDEMRYQDQTGSVSHPATRPGIKAKALKTAKKPTPQPVSPRPKLEYAADQRMTTSVGRLMQPAPHTHTPDASKADEALTLGGKKAGRILPPNASHTNATKAAPPERIDRPKNDREAFDAPEKAGAKAKKHAAPVNTAAGNRARFVNSGTAGWSDPEPTMQDAATLRPTFVSRLFRHLNTAFMRKKPYVSPLEIAASKFAELESAAGSVQQEAPRPSLMAKLADFRFDEEDKYEGAEDRSDAPFPDAKSFKLGDTDEADETGPLTLSLMELETKMKPKAPQIRSFPWLRG